MWFLMRAVVVMEYGGKAEIVELPKPEVGPGQILIKIAAAGMNPMDRTIAGGVWKSVMAATFPMILGFDFAGVVGDIGEEATRFGVGESIMGQLLLPPVGAFGTYAEYVAVSEQATLTRIPSGVDPAVAAAAPTAGMSGLAIVDSLSPLDGKTVLIVGGAGGVGSFVTQLAANAGAKLIANVRQENDARMQSYGVTEIVAIAAPLAEVVARSHPDGIDVLIDVVSDANDFAALAALVRKGGSALTTRYVADVDALAANGVAAINFQLPASSELLERVAEALAAKTIIPPPIKLIPLVRAPVAFDGEGEPLFDGKTVIVM
jgi:NADPH:quinone reductase-like Zn-dependent oxidoreductase